MPEPGGKGGSGATAPLQYLADQVTLFQPGEGRLSLLLLLAPPKKNSPSGITGSSDILRVLNSE